MKITTEDIRVSFHAREILNGVSIESENNELALTDNKHGEVAKYFTYSKHQMIPDVLIANYKFLNGLSDEERTVFEEAARISTETELEEWEIDVQSARKTAEEQMNVTFIENQLHLL